MKTLLAAVELRHSRAFVHRIGCAALWLSLSVFTLFGQVAAPQDFGDAPFPYPTMKTNNGAQHTIVQGFHLGLRIDAEPDGQPDPNALGDDAPTAGGPGDEDGVTFATPLLPSQKAAIKVVASENGLLDAWIDFDANGSWAEPADQIFASFPLNPGTNTLTILVPASAHPGFTFARFRLSKKGGLSFVGPAADGEVEDYRVQIGPDSGAGGPGTPACDFTNKGTNFWLAFPANYAPDSTNRPQLSLHLAGAEKVSGQVTIPGLGYATNWTIPAGLIATVSLPWEADLGELNNAITNKGIHITATGEVAVYALNHVPFSSDAYLGLPTGVLGTEYIVLGYPNVHTDVPELNGTQFALVAIEDNTAVTITPRVSTGALAAGLPFTIAMNRGDTYQLRNTNNAPSDLSGTVITSSKPIAVFGSHLCANIPGASQFYCDHLVEQLLPTSAWGTNFVSIPIATRLKGDTYRIVAVQTNTTVRINGIVAAILNRGDVQEQLVTGSVHITSDKPVLVAQYANSSDYDSVTNSDPFMVLVPATKFFDDTYDVFSMTNGFTTNFVNVVVPDSLIGQVQLDGTTISTSNFSPIPAAGPASGFSGAQLPVLPGKHSLTQTSTNRQPFGVTVYGFGSYDSYGYPGGMRFGDLQPPIITCPDSITLTIDATGCVAAVPAIRASVHDNCTPDNALKITQRPPAGTLLGPGTYDLVLSATDLAGNTGMCSGLLKVLDPNQPAIQCPSNMIVRTRNPAGEIVNYNVTAGTRCNPRLEVVCKPASGTRFPIGTTTVTCSLAGGDNPLGKPIQCTFTVTIVPQRVDFTVSKTEIVLKWFATDTLESAPSVAGPWKPVLSAQSPYVISRSDPNLPSRRFYRVRCADCPQPH